MDALIGPMVGVISNVTVTCFLPTLTLRTLARVSIWRMGIQQLCHTGEFGSGALQASGRDESLVVCGDAVWCKLFPTGRRRFRGAEQ
jgi:hypothetical protein